MSNRILRLLRAYNSCGNLDPDAGMRRMANVVGLGRLRLQRELLRLGVVRNAYTVQGWHREGRSA